MGFPVCKKENFAGLQAHRKRGKSALASPTTHHTLNDERSAHFIRPEKMDEISGSLVKQAIFPPMQRASLGHEGLVYN